MWEGGGRRGGRRPLLSRPGQGLLLRSASEARTRPSGRAAGGPLRRRNRPPPPPRRTVGRVPLVGGFSYGPQRLREERV